MSELKMSELDHELKNCEGFVPKHDTIQYSMIKHLQYWLSTIKSRSMDLIQQFQQFGKKQKSSLYSKITKIATLLVAKDLFLLLDARTNG